MSGHTPGPWFTGKGYGNHGIEIVGDGGNRLICGVIGVDRDVRDRDGRVTGTEPVADGIANARLIAAAPELLAELKLVLAWAVEEKSALGPKEIESIREVIAKATQP